MKKFLSTLIIASAMTLSSTSNAESNAPHTELVLGGGCFWCVEAVYERFEGVQEVHSGYAGGHVPQPSYQEVISGRTGHAEVVRIRFNPEQVSVEDLLDFFWVAHDPTTLNRQGADVGTQYRSIILYANEDQKAAALASKERAQEGFTRPIVTEIVPLEAFYLAEDYHQDYFANNPQAAYCQYVIAPKIQQLKAKGKIEPAN